MNEEGEPSPPPAKHKKAIAIAIAIFLVLGIAYFCYWFFWLRFHEYTNDAYVDGNMVMVTPLVPGIVVSFTADNTDFVPEGRILVELDKTDARIALDNAIAELGNAVRRVQELFENVNTLNASISMKKALFVRAAQDYERRIGLIEEGAVSTEDLEHSAADVQSTYADLIATEHSYIAAMAQVEGTTVFDHPLVDQGKDSVRNAYVFLQRCTITAPATGIVAQRTVQVGEHVEKRRASSGDRPLGPDVDHVELQRSSALENAHWTTDKGHNGHLWGKSSISWESCGDWRRNRLSLFRSPAAECNGQLD